METKKIYEAPYCEITRFAVEDIIAGSDWYTDEFGLLSIDDSQ